MADDIVVFPAGSMAKGIEVRTINFGPEVAFDFETYNVTHGILVGTGPRYGFATIPGQADSEAVTGTRLPGLVGSEGNAAQGLDNRLKILGLVAMNTPSSTLGTSIVSYYAVVTVSESGSEYIDILPCSTYLAGAVNRELPSANLYDGFGVSTVARTSPYESSVWYEALIAQASTRAVTKNAYTLYTSGKYYASVATYSSSGSNVPMQWVFGAALATGDATHAPNAGYQYDDGLLDNPTGSSFGISGGIPSEYQLGNFTTAQRSLTVFALTVKGDLNIQYSATFVPTTSILVANQYEGSTAVGTSVSNLVMTAVTATKNTAGTTYSATKGVLVNDSDCVTSNSYQAILVAAEKPYAKLVQDPYRTFFGAPTQWVDLTQNSWQPPAVNATYVESGFVKKSSFMFWPDFVRGTAMVTQFCGASGFGPGLGPASSGVLRKNTVYEFTYSIYNKRLNTESNVGSPVKFQTGANDFVALQLFVNGTQKTQFASWNATPEVTLPFAYGQFSTNGYTSTFNLLNFQEYRFYYRQEGTYEWLPALFIDAARWWFSPESPVYACAGPIASLPGGQPGGFSDYSPLPAEKYIDVKTYKDRAFWCSSKSIYFSIRNNLFAYPARNSISIPTGRFLGMIVHNYPGQAQQSSRLVIFGSDTIYVARFTGLPQQTQVQVSADTSATFNLDGTDLVIDPWTSVTAFSYRSAVVADGILYYWGPQGIYRDDGVQTPTKISGDDLEPDIFDVYDPNRTDETHAFYDEHTKDITWFYVPRTTGGSATHALVYNTTSGEFLRNKYFARIDWVSNLNITSNIGTAGKRGVAGARASSIQRAYFYDLNNRAGDIYPTVDFVVKQISTPSTGLRRLTLATGYTAAAFNQIIVGDVIALDNVVKYTGVTTSDIVATVAALGAGTIDITLPTGATLANATLTFDQYFPIWQKTAAGAGLNGISWQIKTFYWAPVGMNAYWYWLYTYFLVNVVKWKTDLGLSVDFAYRNATSPTSASDTLPLFAAGEEPNSDENAQIYKRMTIGADHAEGQAILYTLSGVHIGHEWTLQYMEAHNRPILIEPLFRFMV